MKKGNLVSVMILLIVAVFNTGCIEDWFVKEKKPQQHISSSNNIIPPPPSNYKDTVGVEGCSADITEQKNSNCDRGTISETELKHTPKQGEVHTLRSLRGKVIHIGERKTGFVFPEYKNKIIILEIFGKDCPHCLKELSTIKRIRNEYKGKLEVISIQAQDRMSTAEAIDYINRNNIRYPIIEGDDATNLQYFIQKTYEWRGILPYILVVKNGVTEFSYSGEVDYKDLKRDIDSIL
jgi:thiol-disulfide isomerase/thioredoxin